MPAIPLFTKEQSKLLQDAANRVWQVKFKDLDAPQKKMALALGVSQQSVSLLLRGKYTPGLRVAEEIATLDGLNSLEELIGPYAREKKAPKGKGSIDTEDSGPSSFSNLNVCVQFFAASKHWSPWTIAAARAGFFGNADFAPPEWAGKLDSLEKALERARRTG